MNEAFIQKIEAIADEVATSVGCQLYDIEFGHGAQGRVLQVFIDKEGGINVDDCANVSRGLNDFLDSEENAVPGPAYALEVSSPGLERKLKKPWHFEKAQGKKVYLKLSKSLGSFGLQNKKFQSAKQISEVLKEASAEGLHFEFEGELVVIPLAGVEKAKLVFDFNEGNNKDSFKENKKEKKKNKK